MAATGAGLLLLPLFRLLTGGIGWAQAFPAGMDTVLALDIAFALGGSLCLLSALRRPAVATFSGGDALDEAVTEP